MKKVVRTLLVVAALLTAMPTITVEAQSDVRVSEVTPVTADGGLKGFVTRLYSKVLGRTPENSGLNYWMNEIQSGKQSVMNVATHGFFNSKEFTNKNVDNGEFVKICYRTFLDREAETSGYNYWVKMLNNGSTREYVISGFAYSNEFAKIMQSFGLSSNSTVSTKTTTTTTKSNVATSNAGKVTIYRGNTVVYEMALATSTSAKEWQKIVDNKSTALIADFLGKKMLADHAADGLKAMKNCQVGDKLVITKDGKTTTYKMTKMDKNAVNTGSGIRTEGKYADQLNYGELFAYCCNDSTGVSVTVTFWKKA